MTIELVDWLDEVSGPQWLWYVKRLTGNDTLANKTNQYGPHIDKQLLFRLFPQMATKRTKNPDVFFPLVIASHADARTVRAVYYNNKFHENPTSGRNEARITGFGGAASALLDPESTGAVTIIAFNVDPQSHASRAEVWVARDELEEDQIEERVGPVEPGKAIIWPFEQLSLLGPANAPSSCWLAAHEIPPAWLLAFPTTAEIVAKSVELRSNDHLDPDQRLLRRRDCEYEIFRSVEQAVELPAIKAGFTTIGAFVDHAQSVLQRRKSRSGRSLELQTRQIFLEEMLKEGVNFSHQPKSDGHKKPDFLFPSEAAYQDSSFPKERLRMLAVKTTCKDRWRQITKEADRIEKKHLLTLQEGVSVNQFHEMVSSGVQLVVPKKLINSYPASVRPNLQTLESFIGDVRLLPSKTS